ncbi:hypothetical protein KQY30_20060 [Streptomyces sp. GMY02]|uniref:hypothetical protein n=1 Tax=Streptomyces sp. GMY02 TaxID=1333528 RepID=UPI001C2BF29D|nr:hypothetical protein [Streptomyces sp. GMY02]QXE36195.1 hypothetical protein KQY30_20060 [Streptomyces sp. GMY02]
MTNWTMEARVRIVADLEAANPYGPPRKYRAGEEVDMLLVGQEGKPMSAAMWWSSMDIDNAYILPGDSAVVLEMKGPVWIKCGSCGKGGRIERGSDQVARVDVGGRIAKRRAEERREAARQLDPDTLPSAPGCEHWRREHRADLCPHPTCDRCRHLAKL